MTALAFDPLAFVDPFVRRIAHTPAGSSEHDETVEHFGTILRALTSFERAALRGLHDAADRRAARRAARIAGAMLNRAMDVTLGGRNREGSRARVEKVSLLLAGREDEETHRMALVIGAIQRAVYWLQNPLTVNNEKISMTVEEATSETLLLIRENDEPLGLMIDPAKLQAAIVGWLPPEAGKRSHAKYAPTIALFSSVGIPMTEKAIRRMVERDRHSR